MVMLSTVAHPAWLVRVVQPLISATAPELNSGFPQLAGKGRCSRALVNVRALAPCLYEKCLTL
jgi:hypothetical protein